MPALGLRSQLWKTPTRRHCAVCLRPPPNPHPGAVWKREKARLLPGHRGKVTCPSIACLLLGALVRCELRTSQIRTCLEVTVSKTVTGPRTHNVQWRVTETSSVNAACPPALGWCHLPQIWHAGPAPDAGLPPSPSLPAQGYPDWTWKAPGDRGAGHGRLRPQHAPRAGLPRHELTAWAPLCHWGCGFRATQDELRSLL